MLPKGERYDDNVGLTSVTVWDAWRTHWNSPWHYTCYWSFGGPIIVIISTAWWTNAICMSTERFRKISIFCLREDSTIVWPFTVMLKLPDSKACSQYTQQDPSLATVISWEPIYVQFTKRNRNIRRTLKFWAMTRSVEALSYRVTSSRGPSGLLCTLCTPVSAKQ